MTTGAVIFFFFVLWVSASFHHWRVERKWEKWLADLDRRGLKIVKK